MSHNLSSLVRSRLTSVQSLSSETSLGDTFELKSNEDITLTTNTLLLSVDVLDVNANIAVFSGDVTVCNGIAYLDTINSCNGNIHIVSNLVVNENIYLSSVYPVDNVVNVYGTLNVANMNVVNINVQNPSTNIVASTITSPNNSPIFVDSNLVFEDNVSICSGTLNVTNLQACPGSLAVNLVGNLSVSQNLTVGGAANIFSLNVINNIVSANLTVSTNASIPNLNVTNSLVVSGIANVANINVTGNLIVSGNTTVPNLNVYQTLTANNETVNNLTVGNLTVLHPLTNIIASTITSPNTDPIFVDSNLVFEDNVSICSGTLNVTNLQACPGSLGINIASNVNIQNNLVVTGSITAGTMPFPHTVIARIYQNTSQTLGVSITSAIVKFDTVDFDPYSLYTSAIFGYTIKTTGYYLAYTNSASSATLSIGAVRTINIQKNGSNAPASTDSQPLTALLLGGSASLKIMTVLRLVVGDTLQVAYTGISADVISGGTNSFTLSLLST